jgi:hypothetical protein
MAASIVEQNITVVQRLCKTGSKGFVWRSVRDHRATLLLAILDGALAQKRARAIRLKHIFVDVTPAAYPSVVTS